MIQVSIVTLWATCFENPTQFFMFLPYISKFPDFSLTCSFKILRLFPDFKLNSKIPLRITQFPDNVLTLKKYFSPDFFSDHGCPVIFLSGTKHLFGC